jgi:hypothetical protein
MQLDVAEQGEGPMGPLMCGITWLKLIFALISEIKAVKTQTGKSRMADLL